VVDLGADTLVSSVTVDFFKGEGSWIHLPRSVDVFLSPASSSGSPVPPAAARVDAAGIAKAGNVVRLDFTPRRARYVRVVAKGAGTIRDGLPGAGNPAWLFVDEIVVE